MSSESCLNTYYRTIISSFSINNTREQNVLLLNEVNDFIPELVQEAHDLITRGNITKYQYLSNETHQSFYVNEGEKTYFTIHGYCTCFRHRDNILIKEKEFTCVHEIVLIILEYIFPYLNKNTASFLSKTVCLTEYEFLDKLKSLSGF
ncbi:hypothetical protein MACJ_003882 [Theileria orientalis]|uniref:SWIM-type domain-containing protein n=1 Tax=Theileria orientalis TaxID=68886 RepID=A0A976SKT5_THEOR|nr:hypothetical protein MACJ_003882 [Theileria orientalis]